MVGMAPLVYEAIFIMDCQIVLKVPPTYQTGVPTRSLKIGIGINRTTHAVHTSGNHYLSFTYFLYFLLQFFFRETRGRLDYGRGTIPVRHFAKMAKTGGAYMFLQFAACTFNLSQMDELQLGVSMGIPPFWQSLEANSHSPKMVERLTA
jgi:hypothetical protein